MRGYYRAVCFCANFCLIRHFKDLSNCELMLGLRVFTFSDYFMPAICS
ncbi:MAG: hypothetical protein OFPI_23440 [Osedax symbiont Rs2]|nr:MAG: hypothetical protein OFPI_23440 [Osedax symbiont Rs2]